MARSGPRRWLSLMAPLLVMAACSGSGSADGRAGNPPATDRPGTRSPGCGGPALTSGRQEVELASGGQTRRYSLFVPAEVSQDEPAPLVMFFTAYSPASLEEGFAELIVPDDTGRVKADEVGAVVVAPEPVGGDGALRTWNLTDQPGWPDDQRFVTDLLADVRSRACVDLDRLLVTGFAIGGVMASTVACERADDVDALVTVSGLYDPPGCDPDRPVPVLAFHGTADPLIAFGGGLGPNVGQLDLGPETAAGLAGVVANFDPVPEVARAWAERNGCSAGPDTTAVAPTVSREEWSCPPGAAVELYVIEGGGHTWPGSDGTKALAGLLGPTSDAIVATDLAWDFFTAQPR